MMPMGGLFPTESRAHTALIRPPVVLMAGLTLSAACTYLGDAKSRTGAVVFFFPWHSDSLLAVKGLFWAFLTDTRAKA